MKRFTFAVAAIGAATAMFVTPADAQMASVVRPVKFGVAFGGTLPQGNNDSFTDELETGYHVQALVAFQPAFVPFGLRAEFMYHTLDLKEQDFLGTPINGDLRVLAGTLNGLFSFGPALSPVRPYLIAGVGMYNNKLTLEASGESDDLDATDFGINGGVGVEFRLAGFSAFAEGRFHNVFVNGDDADEDTPFGSNDKHFRFVPLSFGIMF